MPDITEYGNVMLNGYVDEFGRRRINGLLEDGVKILALFSAPIIKVWSNSLETVSVFRRPNRAIKLVQALQTLHMWAVTIPTLIIKQWLASVNLFHALYRPERKIFYGQALKASHFFTKPLVVIRIPAFLSIIHTSRRPQRLLRLLQQSGLIHTFYVSKPGVKKTRLFLVIGELAFQLSGD